MTARTNPIGNSLPNIRITGSRTPSGMIALVTARLGRSGSVSRKNQSVVIA